MDKSPFRLHRSRWTLVLAVACAVGASAATGQPWVPSDRTTARAPAQAQGFVVRIGIDAHRLQSSPNSPSSLRIANDGTPGAVASWLVASAPGTSARHLTGDWYVVAHRAPSGPQRSHQLAAHLAALPEVRAVTPNAQEPRAALPNDTLFGSEQWWLRAYDASASGGVANFPAAWDRSTGLPAMGLGAIVAVLDSGITSHPDLNARLVGPGYDFVSRPEYANDGDGRDNDPSDPGDALPKAEHDANLDLWDGCSVAETSSWHGTLVAGQLGAITNNGAGVAGINWGARVLPVRVGGKCGAAVADLVDGMRWAAGLDVSGVPTNPNPARILVVGFAGFEPCDTTHPTPAVAAAAQLYVDVLAELRGRGVLVVAAAGNERAAVGRPASCPGAFAVTSLNRLGFKALYANWGPQVALSTVGGDAARGASCDAQLADAGMVSTFNAGSTAPGAFGYGAGSGTSFAAPGVAGTASLMLAVNPTLTLAELERGLKLSAKPHALVPALGVCDAGKNAGRCQCSTLTCGVGVLDAEQALAFAADPVGYAPPQRNPISLDSAAIRQCAAALGLAPLPEPAGPVASEPVVDAGGGGGGLDFRWCLALLLAVTLVSTAVRDQDGP